MNQNLAFLKRKIDIDYDGEILNLQGSFWDMNFDIYKGSDLIGEIEKTLFAMTDTYRLTVHDDNYREALLALTLCLNNIKDTAKSRSNSAG